ncbi:CDP-diacylglycerol--glycerol-3-phosphate 3-phosphatidyltransferase [Adlercreutzia equolifaciens]|uniref:CDP-diacylglycerol--glycerol-3-phosphate 3-phosphatidyltransferase n=1 Tax=Adlercreutzia equolifaciens TaxID=446660 RepID=UPI0023B047DB|nr:CDP-diacylglycerol--glycerol-3-phosphate 3-phosphatidyltransferase [Adlercreutzia equolifaciens]MDE8703195.1 CDP-diacylglycerol--glycerol-3-phosphate 3-phosphatidyltransferase [Adlercreutzia equolifaciens]
MTVIEPTAPEKLWTPANIVTLIRICLVPVFVLAIVSPWPEWVGLPGITLEAKRLIAAGIFILISCTDWIDGYLARSRGEVTDFGKFMDPLADKILVAAALIALVELAVLPGWPVLIILAREFIVSGIRMIAASKGEVIAASWYGKAKTVFQILAIILFLIKDSLTFNTAGAAFTNPMFVLAWFVMVIALVLTIMSMLDYLVKARKLLRGVSSATAKTTPAVTTPEPPMEIAALQKAIDERAADVIQLAAAKQATISTAESLTGGLIAAMLTSVPGSSTVVRGGIVSYVNDVKEQLLGVSDEVLSRQGAVDETVALQMARGSLRELRTNVAVSVTGIAGPTGAEPGKPVGTVWLGCATQTGTHATLLHFEGGRQAVRLQTTLAALDALKEALQTVETR